MFLSVQPRPAQPQLQFFDQLQDFAGGARFQDIGDQRSGEGLNEAGDIQWIRHDFLVSKRTAVCTLSRWQQPGTRRRYSRTVRASPEGIYLAPCLVSNIAHLSTLFLPDLRAIPWRTSQNHHAWPNRSENRQIRAKVSSGLPAFASESLI